MPAKSHPSATLPAAVPVIPDNAWYRLHTLQQALGISSPRALPKEIKARRLRASKRLGCVWIKGEWVSQWLAGGEVYRAERNGHAGKAVAG